MSEPSAQEEPPFHLLLDGEEIEVTRTALGLLISSESHEPQIRALAREVLASLDTPPPETGPLSVPLHSKQMKITHTAVRLLFDDSQRGQAAERELLRGILEKLPDEHTMRAIIL